MSETRPSIPEQTAVQHAKAYLLGGMKHWLQLPVVNTLTWLFGYLASTTIGAYVAGALSAGTLAPRAIWAWCTANPLVALGIAGWFALPTVLLFRFTKLALTRRPIRIQNDRFIKAIGLKAFFDPDRQGTQAAWNNCGDAIRLLKPTEISIFAVTGWQTFAEPNAPLYQFINAFSGRIEVMLLEPDSTGWHERIDDMAVDSGGHIDHSKKTMLQARFRDEFSKTHKFCEALQNKSDRVLKSIEVRTYTEKPIWKFVFANHYVWVQHYPIGEPVVEAPAFVFAHQEDRDATFFHPYQETWRRRWKAADTKVILKRD